MKRHAARLALGAALTGALVLGTGGTALAAGDSAEVRSCWGTVVSQRASTYGDLGEHSSSFAGEPRIGVGNLPELFGFAKVGELADLDGLAATHCPR